MRHLLLPATLLLILTGCGGGGGDQAATSSPPPTGEIGRRSVPGYEVVVVREAGAPAGAYRVEVLGSPAPQQVAAWVACCGYDSTATTVTAEAIAGIPGAWRVTVPTISGKLWIRVTDAGGNVVEAGGDDFPIGP